MKAEQAPKPKTGVKGAKGASESGEGEAHESAQAEGAGQAHERDSERLERPHTQAEALEHSHADEEARAETHEEADRQRERKEGVKPGVKGNLGSRGGQAFSQKQPASAAAQKQYGAALRAGGSDGFEKVPTQQKDPAAALRQAQATQRLPPAPSLPQPRANLGGALGALHQAKDPGVYFKEHGPGSGQAEEDEDPELAAAVEETIRLLFGVRGIHRVGPGESQAGVPVVVIAAGRGFSQASLSVIPPRVHRFDTVLALPYELLPLRRQL